MIENLGNGMALVDGIVFVTEHPAVVSTVEPTPPTEAFTPPTVEVTLPIVEVAMPTVELTPEERRRAQWREASRRRREGLPRKYRPRGERTRAEQIRAAGRDYYHRHQEEILLRRKAMKEGAA